MTELFQNMSHLTFWKFFVVNWSFVVFHTILIIIILHFVTVVLLLSRVLEDVSYDAHNSERPEVYKYNAWQFFVTLWDMEAWQEHYNCCYRHDLRKSNHGHLSMSHFPLYLFFFSLMTFSECIENNILIIWLLCEKLYWAKSKCISGN